MTIMIGCTAFFLLVSLSCAPPLTWHPALHLFVWHVLAFEFGIFYGTHGRRLCLMRLGLLRLQVLTYDRRGVWKMEKKPIPRAPKLFGIFTSPIRCCNTYTSRCHTSSYRYITPQQNATYRNSTRTLFRINDAASQANRIHAACSIAETCCHYAVADATTFKPSR